jgi:hypothetical protein
MLTRAQAARARSVEGQPPLPQGDPPAGAEDAAAALAAALPHPAPPPGAAPANAEDAAAPLPGGPAAAAVVGRPNPDCGVVGRLSRNKAPYTTKATQSFAVHRFIQYSRDTKGVFLLHNVGSGKTLTSLSIAVNSLDWRGQNERRVIIRPEDRTILIVHPTGLYDAFHTELCFNMANITYVSCDDATKVYTYQRWSSSPQGDRGVQFRVISKQYKDIKPLFVNGNFDELRAMFKDRVVIFDEAHRLFRPIEVGKGLTYIDAYISNELLQPCRRFVAMTGTPISTGLPDVAKMMQFVNSAIPAANIVQAYPINPAEGGQVDNFDMVKNSSARDHFSPKVPRLSDPNICYVLSRCVSRMKVGMFYYLDKVFVGGTHLTFPYTIDYLQERARVENDKSYTRAFDFFDLEGWNQLVFGNRGTTPAYTVELERIIKTQFGRQIQQQAAQQGGAMTQDEARSVMGVEKSDTMETITSRYRELALQFHPDKNESGTEQFKKIGEAYEVLKGAVESPKANVVGDMFGGIMPVVFSEMNQPEFEFFIKNLKDLLESEEVHNATKGDFESTIDEVAVMPPENYLELFQSSVRILKNCNPSLVKVVLSIPAVPEFKKRDDAEAKQILTSVQTLMPLQYDTAALRSRSGSSGPRTQSGGVWMEAISPIVKWVLTIPQVKALRDRIINDLMKGGKEWLANLVEVQIYTIVQQIIEGHVPGLVLGKIREALGSAAGGLDLALQYIKPYLPYLLAAVGAYVIAVAVFDKESIGIIWMKFQIYLGNKLVAMGLSRNLLGLNEPSLMDMYDQMVGLGDKRNAAILRFELDQVHAFDALDIERFSTAVRKYASLIDVTMPRITSKWLSIGRIPAGYPDALVVMPLDDHQALPAYIGNRRNKDTTGIRNTNLAAILGLKDAGKLIDPPRPQSNYPRKVVEIAQYLYTIEQIQLFRELKVDQGAAQTQPWYYSVKEQIRPTHIGNFSADVRKVARSEINLGGNPNSSVVAFDSQANKYVLKMNRPPIQLPTFACPKFEKLLAHLLLAKAGLMFSANTGDHKVYQAHYYRDPDNALNAVNPDGFIEPQTYDEATHHWLPFVYSTSDVMGLNLFAYFLERNGFKYVVLHEDTRKDLEAPTLRSAINTVYPLRKQARVAGEDPITMLLTVLLHQETAVNWDVIRAAFPTGDEPICVLLHPFRTEGIDAKHTPSIFLMEPPVNYGDYEQLCGRVLRTYSREYDQPPKKMVFQMIGDSYATLENFNDTYNGVEAGLESLTRANLHALSLFFDNAEVELTAAYGSRLTEVTAPGIAPFGVAQEPDVVEPISMRVLKPNEGMNIALNFVRDRYERYKTTQPYVDLARPNLNLYEAATLLTRTQADIGDDFLSKIERIQYAHAELKRSAFGTLLPSGEYGPQYQRTIINIVKKQEHYIYLTRVINELSSLFDRILGVDPADPNGRRRIINQLSPDELLYLRNLPGALSFNADVSSVCTESEKFQEMMRVEYSFKKLLRTLAGESGLSDIEFLTSSVSPDSPARYQPWCNEFPYFKWERSGFEPPAAADQRIRDATQRILDSADDQTMLAEITALNAIYREPVQRAGRGLSLPTRRARRFLFSKRRYTRRR